LISAIVLTFTVSIVGKIPAQILSPSTTASFVLADIITELTNLDKYHLNINLDQSHILAWIAIIIIIAAIFQIIFGVLKFGNLIQYIPYPVISGFLNGIGILFVISQWKIFLGLDQKLNYSFEKAINEMSIWNIIIGIITVLALFSAKEWRKKYPKMPPAPIIGISIGVLTYHYLKYIGSYNIGPVIGKLSMSFDNLFPIKIFPKIFTDDAFFTLLPFLLKSGLTLAIVMSISTLLTTLLIGVINENRYSGNRTLKTHGLAHIFSSILGGTVGTSSLSIINIKMGAKTRLSSICCGIFLLIFLIFFQNLIAELPYVVIAGTLVYF
ncbi:MAG: SulP family inorganic anion transporter, partial [Legionellales bacterium]|nr:SulP family inorganic anion transporter [Legionellales bacterium]